MNHLEKCTLTDQQLIDLANSMVNDLAQTGGRAWTMRVPVDFDRDHDMIFSELISRFEKLSATNRPQENCNVAIMQLQRMGQRRVGVGSG